MTNPNFRVSRMTRNFLWKCIISARSETIKWGNHPEHATSFIESIKPIENFARYGSDFYAKSIKTAIKTTSKILKGFRPLTVYTALDETFLINQTARSRENLLDIYNWHIFDNPCYEIQITVDVTVVNPVTVATITGAILGDDVYEFHTYQFVWQNRLCNT